MLTVEALAGPEALPALAADWERLAADCGRPRFFHWYGWWKCCVQHLEPDPAAVTFFVARQGRRPVAIVPLARENGAWPGARVWGLPRHPHMPVSGFPMSLDLDAEVLRGALAQALERHAGESWDALRFEPLLAESPLARVAAGRGLHRAVVKSCDEIRCSAQGEDHRLRLSPNFRSNLNKARNKLAREREVVFASATQPEALDAALAEFLELEASGWKGRDGAGTAIRLHPALRAFYRGLVRELAPAGRVVINGLRLAGRLVAGQFCLRDADTLYVLKLAYDETCARLAPGNMLLERVVTTARAAAGIERINLVGEPPWFKDWRPEGQDAVRLLFTNATLRGRALAGWLGLRGRLQPAWRRLRGPVRAAAAGGSSGTRAAARATSAGSGRGSAR